MVLQPLCLSFIRSSSHGGYCFYCLLCILISWRKKRIILLMTTENELQTETSSLGVFPWGGDQSEGSGDPGHDR